MVVKVKQWSERCQRFPFNSSEEKRRSERSQAVDLNNSESITV